MRRRMEMAAERNKKKADKKKAASVKKSERPKRKR